MSNAISMPLTNALAAARSAPKREVRRVRIDWVCVIESLFGELDAVAERVHAALRVQYSGDHTARFDLLHSDMATSIVRLLSAARGGGVDLNRDDLADLAIAGETWARHGIPVDEMMRAWHTGVEAVVDGVRDAGQRHGVDDADLLEFVQSAYMWSDVALVAAAKGHRTAEIELAVAEEERREGFVRKLLFGTVPLSELRVGAEAYGLDPDCDYIAVRARLGDGVQQRKLEQALGFHDSGRRRRGLCAVVDGALAGILIGSPPATVSGVVGVGPRRPLRSVADSYRLATRALMTMQACGLRGAHDFASLGLRPAIAMDSDTGEILRTRYLDPLVAADSGRELIATMRAYLACDMHVERTASRLFVHQNTVRYRLARFEELTGASLRSTDAVVELWWALALSEMDL